MRKSELKKAFEQNFRNITVSDELKEKTLNAVNSSYIKTPSRLPYLKNFAAIFIVTMLCISIYFAKTSPKVNSISAPPQEESYSTPNTITENYKQEEFKTLKSSTEKGLLPTNSTESSQFSISKSLSAPLTFGEDSANTILQDSIMVEGSAEENTEEKNITSEEEFLTLYPNAEKLENGYRLYENNKEILYVFKNGILENVITSD